MSLPRYNISLDPTLAEDETKLGMTKIGKFYVYLHIKLTNGEPFYVGKGKNRRAKDKDNRNPHWHNIVNKYGYDTILLEDGLTEGQAFELEKYWIQRLGREDLGKGTLVNMTDGGEGGSGRTAWNKGKICPSLKGPKHSDEYKEKCRQRFLGKHSKLKGVKLSEEHRAAIKEGWKKRKPMTQETKDKIRMSVAKIKRKPMTQETKDKISLAKKRNKNG